MNAMSFEIMRSLHKLQVKIFFQKLLSWHSEHKKMVEDVINVLEPTDEKEEMLIQLLTNLEEGGHLDDVTQTLMTTPEDFLEKFSKFKDFVEASTLLCDTDSQTAVTKSQMISTLQHFRERYDPKRLLPLVISALSSSLNSQEIKAIEPYIRSIALPFYEREKQFLTEFEKDQDSDMVSHVLVTYIEHLAEEGKNHQEKRTENQDDMDHELDDMLSQPDATDPCLEPKVTAMNAMSFEIIRKLHQMQVKIFFQKLLSWHSNSEKMVEDVLHVLEPKDEKEEMLVTMLTNLEEKTHLDDIILTLKTKPEDFLEKVKKFKDLVDTSAILCTTGSQTAISKSQMKSVLQHFRRRYNLKRLLPLVISTLKNTLNDHEIKAIKPYIRSIALPFYEREKQFLTEMEQDQDSDKVSHVLEAYIERLTEQDKEHQENDMAKRTENLDDMDHELDDMLSQPDATDPCLEPKVTALNAMSFEIIRKLHQMQVKIFFQELLSWHSNSEKMVEDVLHVLEPKDEKEEMLVTMLTSLEEKSYLDDIILTLKTKPEDFLKEVRKFKDLVDTSAILCTKGSQTAISKSQMKSVLQHFRRRYNLKRLLPLVISTLRKTLNDNEIKEIKPYIRSIALPFYEREKQFLREMEQDQDSDKVSHVLVAYIDELSEEDIEHQENNMKKRTENHDAIYHELDEALQQPDPTEACPEQKVTALNAMTLHILLSLQRNQVKTGLRELLNWHPDHEKMIGEVLNILEPMDSQETMLTGMLANLEFTGTSNELPQPHDYEMTDPRDSVETLKEFRETLDSSSRVCAQDPQTTITRAKLTSMLQHFKQRCDFERFLPMVLSTLRTTLTEEEIPPIETKIREGGTPFYQRKRQILQEIEQSEETSMVSHVLVPYIRELMPDHPPMPGPATPMPYPGNPHPYPGNPHPYPGSPHPYPGSPHPYPGSPHPYPGSPHPYPGNPHPYPALPPTAEDVFRELHWVLRQPDHSDPCRDQKVTVLNAMSFQMMRHFHRMQVEMFFRMVFGNLPNGHEIVHQILDVLEPDNEEGVIVDMLTDLEENDSHLARITAATVDPWTFIQALKHFREFVDHSPKVCSRDPATTITKQQILGLIEQTKERYDTHKLHPEVLAVLSRFFSQEEVMKFDSLIRGTAEPFYENERRLLEQLARDQEVHLVSQVFVEHLHLLLSLTQPGGPADPQEAMLREVGEALRDPEPTDPCREQKVTVMNAVTFQIMRNFHRTQVKTSFVTFFAGNPRIDEAIQKVMNVLEPDAGEDILQLMLASLEEHPDHVHFTTILEVALTDPTRLGHVLRRFRDFLDTSPQVCSIPVTRPQLAAVINHFTHRYNVESLLPQVMDVLRTVFSEGEVNMFEPIIRNTAAPFYDSERTFLSTLEQGVERGGVSHVLVDYLRHLLEQRHSDHHHDPAEMVFGQVHEALRQPEVTDPCGPQRTTLINALNFQIMRHFHRFQIKMFMERLLGDSPKKEELLQGILESLEPEDGEENRLVDALNTLEDKNHLSSIIEVAMTDPSKLGEALLAFRAFVNRSGEVCTDMTINRDTVTSILERVWRRYQNIASMLPQIISLLGQFYSQEEVNELVSKITGEAGPFYQEEEHFFRQMWTDQDHGMVSSVFVDYCRNLINRAKDFYEE